MKIPIITLLLMVNAIVFGQTALTIGQNQKFIHYDETFGLILIEPLQPGMTLYSLARKYNVSIDQILSINPELEPKRLQLNYPINIPVNKQAITFVPPAEEEPIVWLSYQVQPKETLYRVSKTYLNVAPEVITRLNPSAAQGLRIGQVLHLGWLLQSAAISETVAYSGTDSVNIAPKDFIKDAVTEGEVIRQQKGLAVWKPGSPTSNYYVLHPTAKLGTYMEITNPMLHRTITAKVAGHIPPGLYQSNVGIVVSPSTARALGVLDQQFYAHWRYVE
jgi:LysM repeat protein